MTEANSGEVIGTFHSFRFANFRWLWLGDAFSSAALWIQQTTMAWVIYDLTGSGGLLGAIQSVGNLTSPLVSPLAGLAADRIPRSRIIAVSQFLLFLNAFAVALAIEFHVLHVWNLFAFAICASILNGFNMPARQAMTFDVVPREFVPNAIALSNIAFNVMRTAGPGIGGALIILFGPANNFLVQSLANLGIMITVLRVRLPTSKPTTARRAFLSDMAEGYAWTIGNPQARLLVFMMIIYPLFIIPVHSAVIVIFARNIFHAGAGGLGILLSAIGVGGLIGGVVTASLNRVDRRGMLQLYSLFLCSGAIVGFIVVGSLTKDLWFAALMLMVSGIGGTIFNATNQTVLQLIAPNHLRGRITGVLQVHPLCMAIGVLFTGAASDLVGATSIGAFDGLVALVLGLAVLVFSPRMRDLRLSKLMAEATDDRPLRTEGA